MAAPTAPAAAPVEPVAAATDGRRYVVLAVLCLALLMIGIDGTVVNVALPTLVRDIGASSTELQWVVDAYTIVFASFLLIAATPATGWAGGAASSPAWRCSWAGRWCARGSTRPRR